jgi:hypothetical protein
MPVPTRDVHRAGGVEVWERTVLGMQIRGDGSTKIVEGSRLRQRASLSYKFERWRRD